MTPFTAGVVDYGMGNLRSVEKALLKAGANAFVSHRRRELERADLLVVPGVGAFSAAMGVLRARRLDGLIKEWVSADRPYLGICLGLQLLFESSEEARGVRGLGLLPGRVTALKPKGRLKVPHMGWNQARPAGAVGRAWTDVLPGPAHFYFVHTYRPQTEDESLVWTRTPYGEMFCSAVARKNLVATQFHPEKSGPTGLLFLTRLMSRFKKERTP